MNEISKHYTSESGREYEILVSYGYTHTPMKWGATMADAEPEGSELDMRVEGVYPPVHKLDWEELTSILTEGSVFWESLEEACVNDYFEKML